jgi:20S proteasome alpha/beta subunit
MTIAAGFRCTDGIVLAVDSQYGGGVSKTQGQKIFPIHHGHAYGLTLAGAGHVGLIKRSVQKLVDALKQRIGENQTSLAELQDVMEDVLCEVHNKHVYPAPLDERAVIDFWFLMAAWTPIEGLQLFRTDITSVTKIHDIGTSIGIGSYLGEYLVDLLCAPGMDIEDAKPIAAYIIKAAKDYVTDCGQATFMRVLRSDGTDERIMQDEILNAEVYFEELFGSMRHMLGYLNIGARPAAALETSIGALFVEAIKEFREKQEFRRRALREQRLRLKHLYGS